MLVTPTDNLQVRVTGALARREGPGDLQMRANGTTFRLGDFASSSASTRIRRRTRCAFNGKEVIGLGISMEKGGDIIALGQGLQEPATHRGDAPGRHRA